MRFVKLKIKPPPITIPPVVYISVTSILGTLTGTALSNSLEFDYLAGSSLAISISILGVCAKTKKQKLALLLIASFGLFFSRTLCVLHSTPHSWLVVNNGDLVELNGVVVSNSTTTLRTQGYLSDIDDRLPVTSFEFLGSPPLKTEKQNLFTVEVNGTLAVSEGDKINIIGQIHRNFFTKTTTPMLFVSQKSLVKTNNKNTKVNLEIKQLVRQSVLNDFQGEEKTLVSALFFGERGAGWSEISTKFRHAGLAHILAVSGLHIAIIMTMIVFVVQRVTFGSLISFVLICIVSVFLLSIIESRPPVFRAVLMIVIASTLQIRGQRFSGSGILAAAAMIIVWLEPAVILTSGFILSFLVVFGICIFLPTLQWKLLGPRDNNSPMLETIRYTMSSIWVVGLCAVLIATPLTMYMFGSIAPIGLITGVGGTLFLVIILLIGIIRLTIGWTCPFIDDQLFWCMNLVSSQMVETVTQYGEIPLFFYIVPPNILIVILLFIFLIFIIISTGRIKTKIIIGIFLTLYFFGIVQDGDVVISTLNVAHGTSHIIQDGKTTILVDAGSRADLDIGLHKVLPSLRKRGINKINTIVVTHNDLDHCSAILDLMREIEIEQIYMTPYALANQTRVVRKIVQVAKGKQIKVNEITRGWSVNTNNATITALWPKKGIDYTSSNEASVVLAIKSSGRSVLLTGDINEKTISIFLLQKMNLVDVLEMPHHGQWSNESIALIHKLQPLAVIQSTSKSRYARDKWIIPTSTERLVTCIDGDITTTITVDGKIEINTSYTELSFAPKR